MTEELIQSAQSLGFHTALNRLIHRLTPELASKELLNLISDLSQEGI